MLVYGKNVFHEVDLKKVRRVYLTKNNSSFLPILTENKIRYEIVPKHRLDLLVDGNHQGIVLDICDYAYKEIGDCYTQDFVVILDHLEDPHNFGAIIRTCEAAGIRKILIPKDRSVQVTDTVMKVSAGALNRVDIIQVTNIANAVIDLQKHGFMVYVSAMDGSDYRNFVYEGKRALVIGNEGSGVSRLVREKSDAIISIPMKGSINSLNASVAAGVLIFKMGG